MIEEIFQNLQGLGDTISMVIQFFLHSMRGLLSFLRSLSQAVIFVLEALTFLPAWFGAVVSIVVSVIIIKFIIPGGD